MLNIRDVRDLQVYLQKTQQQQKAEWLCCTFTDRCDSVEQVEMERWDAADWSGQRKFFTQVSGVLNTSLIIYQYAVTDCAVAVRP